MFFLNCIKYYAKFDPLIATDHEGKFRKLHIINKLLRLYMDVKIRLLNFPIIIKEFLDRWMWPKYAVNCVSVFVFFLKFLVFFKVRVMEHVLIVLAE